MLLLFSPVFRIKLSGYHQQDTLFILFLNFLIHLKCLFLWYLFLTQVFSILILILQHWHQLINTDDLIVNSNSYVLAARHRTPFLQGLQDTGDLAHSIPLSCLLPPLLSPNLHQINNAIMSLSFLCKGFYNLSAINGCQPLWKLQQWVCDGHLGDSKQASPADIRMNGISDSHIPPICAPDHPFLVLLELPKSGHPLPRDMEKLWQWSIMPVMCIVEELKEPEIFDLKWNVIAEWWNKYIQILMDYQYGVEIYGFGVGISIDCGNI